MLCELRIHARSPHESVIVYAHASLANRAHSNSFAKGMTTLSFIGALSLIGLKNMNAGKFKSGKARFFRETAHKRRVIEHRA